MEDKTGEQVKGRRKGLRKHYHGHHVKWGDVRHFPPRPLHCLYAEQLLKGREGPGRRFVHLELFVQERVDKKRLDRQRGLCPNERGLAFSANLSFPFRVGRLLGVSESLIAWVEHRLRS